MDNTIRLGNVMTYQSKQLLIAVAYIVGINILINVLPSPLGMIAFIGLTGYSLYTMWRNNNG